ncbi:MAG: hypothetical protein JO272_06755 [Pseudonocardiales bacterium]|nr:hypothetical protein [Pseudonocardiales bacterium]
MANPVTADAGTAPPTEPKTTTGKTLGVLFAVLLVTTLVVGVMSWRISQRVYGTVETVQNTTAPAILEVVAARGALVKADSAAVDSFRSGEVTLTGPGLLYQNQLTLASQSLVQVAARNVTGRGSQRIQLLEALLESYSGLIGQADAHTGTPLGTADLWYASHLVHAGDSPILAELNNLVGDQISVLNAQISASAMTIENLLKWVVPIVLLFVLLVATQVFLRHRFRRLVNPPLLAATLVLIGLSIVTSLAVIAQHRLENSRDILQEVVRLQQEQPSAADVRGQQELGELMDKEDGCANGGCGPTVDRFISDQKSAASTAAKTSNKRTEKLIADFHKRIGSAGENASRKYFILILDFLIIVFVSFGLWPRIEEYRYRAR